MNHFNLHFLTPVWPKVQPQYIVPNSLKRFIETIYIVLLPLLFKYLIYKVVFYFLYLFSEKKTCSKCKPQFIAKNLGKSLALNALCLVWPILNSKNILLWMFIVRKCLWLTGFYAHVCQLQKSKINYSVLIRWVKFGIQGVKL